MSNLLTPDEVSPLQRSRQLSHPKYRADIDGLRAIAVLSVVGFHAFPQWIKGGFVGVDIFFVISGFLISTIIFENLKHDSFSFVQFYSRRIRRIFPALVVVLIACLTFGWFAFLADEYKQLGRHIAAGAGFISNFILWNESGYFDNAADTKPLLHLWSLGIEEQFYIVWPPFLWLAWKCRLNLLLIIVAIATISFALNAIQVNGAGVAAFYSPQTRFWELLVGSCLAYLMLRNPGAFGRLVVGNGNYQSLIGVSLIAASVLLVNKERAFPGWWALLPTMGAALIMAAGSQAWVNRAVLSNRLLVWFGLISYPLYLWHWPLLAFISVMEEGVPPRIMRIGIVLISVGLSWLTYRFVEKPIRLGGRFKLKSISLLVLMVAVGIAGYAVYFSDGFPARVRVAPVSASVLFGPYPHMPMHNDECDQRFPMFKDFSACLGSKFRDPDVVIIGDSHSQHYYNSLATQLNDSSVMNIANFYCFPFSSETHQSTGGCAKKLDSTIAFLKQNESIKTVILTGYFSLLSAGGFVPIREIGWRQALPGWRQVRPLTRDEAKSFVEKGVEVISGISSTTKNIIVILDTPDLLFNPRTCARFDGLPIRRYFFTSDSLASRSVAECGIDKQQYEKRISEYDKLIEQILGHYPNVKVFNPRSLFCRGNFCRAMKGDMPLYFNGDHLTREGADLVIKELIRQYPLLDG